MTERECNEVATCIVMIANRAGQDASELYRRMKPLLKVDRAAMRGIGMLVEECVRSEETHFAIRTGPIAELLNEPGGAGVG